MCASQDVFIARFMGNCDIERSVPDPWKNSDIRCQSEIPAEGAGQFKQSFGLKFN